jgi:hypothetical protein
MSRRRAGDAVDIGERARCAVVVLGAVSLVEKWKAEAAKEDAQLQEAKAVSVLARQATERGDATTACLLRLP